MPKYGKVLQLCEELGYGSNDTKGPQYCRELSRRTNQHRQRFIEQNVQEFAEFPLYYEHEDVQRCASTFLANNGHMFLQLHRQSTGPGNTLLSDER